MEPRAIAAIVEKIARSPLSVSAYFKRHKLPFGRSRSFQYKAQLAANGLDGLVDGRSGGNRRELTAHAQGFIRELPLAVTSFAVTPHALAPIRCRPAKPLPFLNNHLRRVSRPAQMQRQRTDNLEASAGALDHPCFDRPPPLKLQPLRQQTPAHLPP